MVQGGQVKLHQVGANKPVPLAPPVSCGEIGTEKPLERSKQSVFHRNLEGAADDLSRTGERRIIRSICAPHLHKLNAYEAHVFCVRLVSPHK